MRRIALLLAMTVLGGAGILVYVGFRFRFTFAVGAIAFWVVPRGVNPLR